MDVQHPHESLPVDRRAAARRAVRLFVNKFVDGEPFLCELVELSMTGVLLRRVHEPEGERACYALEIAAPGSERMWLCATPVWSLGRFEALTFVGASHLDKLKLADLLERL